MMQRKHRSTGTSQSSRGSLFEKLARMPDARDRLVTAKPVTAATKGRLISTSAAKASCFRHALPYDDRITVS